MVFFFASANAGEARASGRVAAAAKVSAAVAIEKVERLVLVVMVSILPIRAFGLVLRVESNADWTWILRPLIWIVDCTGGQRVVFTWDKLFGMRIGFGCRVQLIAMWYGIEVGCLAEDWYEASAVCRDPVGLGNEEWAAASAVE
jgi:hypothetical protein